MVSPDTRRKKETFTLIVVFVGVLLISAFAVYFLSGRTAQRGARQEPVQQTEATPTPGAGAVERKPSPSGKADDLMEDIFGAPPSPAQVERQSWGEIVAGLTFRLSLAALLGAVLAFRPRKRLAILKPNPYVAQSQILLAVVALALMIIVGDNAARAFGIFAAVSLVRFRTNIRDPKEITVLLISLAIGLASGVGRWDLAIVLTLFSLLALWLLEWREPEQVFRSMELKVTTRNVVSTQKALRQVLKQHGFDKELRAIDREATEESPGSIMYSVDVSPTVSTDEISADILALDGQNVEAIEWDQKKSYSYMYQ